MHEAIVVHLHRFGQLADASSLLPWQCGSATVRLEMAI
jgi:hypothetical protein